MNASTRCSQKQRASKPKKHKKTKLPTNKKLVSLRDQRWACVLKRERNDTSFVNKWYSTKRPKPTSWILFVNRKNVCILWLFCLDMCVLVSQSCSHHVLCGTLHRTVKELIQIAHLNLLKGKIQNVFRISAF